MSVQPGPTEKRYVANGVSITFTVPFLVIEAGDLKVFLNGVQLTSGYTHTGVGLPTSAIAFAVAPTGDLYLLLDVPFQRLNDYQENGDFLASTVNRDFDRIWQALKQLYGWAARSLRLGTFDTDGNGWYRAKDNGIRNLRDPVEPQDAATKIWAQRYIGDLIEVGQGPVNTAANVLYTTPQGVVKTVQDMSGAGGAAMIGESHGGSIQDRLNIISCGTGVSFKDSGMIGDYVSPSNRGTVNKVEWGKMLSLHGGRFYAEPNANYYLGAIGATDLLATITHGEPIYIDLQGATLWLDLESPTQGRLTAALAYTIDTPIYCYGGGVRCITQPDYPTRGIMPFYCTVGNKPTSGYGLGNMVIEKMQSLFCVYSEKPDESINRISGVSFDGYVACIDCYYGLNAINTGDSITGKYTSIRSYRSYFAYGGSGHDLTVISRDGRNATGDVMVQVYDKNTTKNINLRVIQINGMAPVKLTFTQDKAGPHETMAMHGISVDLTSTGYFAGLPPFVVSHQVGELVLTNSTAAIDGLKLSINTDWQVGTISNPQALSVLTRFASAPRISLNDGARTSLYDTNGAAIIMNGKTIMSAPMPAIEFQIPRRMVFNRDIGLGSAIVRFLVSFTGLNAAGAAVTLLEEIIVATSIASTGNTTIQATKATRLLGTGDTTVYIGLAVVDNNFRINVNGQLVTHPFNSMSVAIEKVAQG